MNGLMLLLGHPFLAGKTTTCAVIVAVAVIHTTPAASGLKPTIGPNRAVSNFVFETLGTLLGAEFAGRRVPGKNALGPPCKPDDFEYLRAGGEPIRAESFVPSCKVAELRLEETYMHFTSYLPRGSCETIRNALDDILKYAVHAKSEGSIDFEYKGAKYSTKRGNAVRSAQLQALCQADGSLRITAVRRRG